MVYDPVIILWVRDYVAFALLLEGFAYNRGIVTVKKGLG